MIIQAILMSKLQSNSACDWSCCTHMRILSQKYAPETVTETICTRESDMPNAGAPHTPHPVLTFHIHPPCRVCLDLQVVPTGLTCCVTQEAPDALTVDLHNAHRHLHTCTHMDMDTDRRTASVTSASLEIARMMHGCGFKYQDSPAPS